MLPAVASRPVLTIHIRTEFDVIASRLRAREIAASCGFATLDQSRIATVVSELARNSLIYAESGTVAFSVVGESAPQRLQIVVDDRGPGIASLATILEGRYRSPTGMGLGILSARRLMEHCDISTGPSGTCITVARQLPPNAPFVTADLLDAIVGQFAQLPNNAALSQAKAQNQELTEALSAQQRRQDALELATIRLEETNRRVEALNALLDVKAAALQQADRSKDQFLAILSHELRGPLSAAGMAAQLLQTADISAARAKQMGELVGRQISHMSKMVEDLLDVSRVSRGLVALAKTPVDLASVVTAAVEQVGGAAEAKRHRLEHVPPALPVVVLGDHTRLVQILGNLLSNAIRYTEPGGHVRVALAVQGAAALLSVTDNGRGIDAALMPRLFDLYVQAERSSDRTGGGLGLGLALVKNLVEAHDGSVTVASAGAGLGSTFTLRLPLHLERRSATP